MIVLRIKPRTTLTAGTAVHISDVASMLCDARLGAHALTVPMPKDAGVWLVDAGSVMSVLYKHFPHEKITVLGDSIGWLQRTPGHTPKALASEWFRLACCAVFARICPPVSQKRRANAGHGSDLDAAPAGKGGRAK